ncbi:MAG: DUF6576 domain-containing protein, partial [Opitutaceae bacterium]
FQEGTRFPRRLRPELELPGWLKRTSKDVPLSTTEPANAVIGPREVRAEVDRILDKINSHGFGALTADEKRVLDGAKDLLSRR